MLAGEQDEIERLHYMHGIFNMMFDNRLIFPPIPRPRRILECGSGSGAWAMEVAEQYPECEVCEPFPDNIFTCSGTCVDVDHGTGPKQVLSSAFLSLHLSQTRRVRQGVDAAVAGMVAQR